MARHDEAHSSQHIGDGAKRVNRDPGEVDIVAYVFTCLAAARRVPIESCRRTIAYFGRLPHYSSLPALRLDALLQAGLKQAVLFPLSTAGDAKRPRLGSG